MCACVHVCIKVKLASYIHKVMKTLLMTDHIKIKHAGSRDGDSKPYKILIATHFIISLATDIIKSFKTNVFCSVFGNDRMIIALEPSYQ